MALVRQSKLPLVTLFLAFCCVVSAFAAPQSSVNIYIAHLESLQDLLNSCRSNASSCDAGKIGSDEQVSLAGLNSGANVSSFDARYDWLRGVFKSAHDPAMKDRATALDSAANRLRDALNDAKEAAASTSAPGFGRARASANAILRHPEFVTVTEQSIWQRIAARIFLWLDSLFGNVAKFGERSPWIGPLFEWALIALALTGLAVWAMRVLQRQRLKVTMEAGRQAEPWEEASRNWRTQAAEQAEKQNWREAVHCLYWATIVMLEGRRMWAPNRSRTPREYVRLLEAGSPRWTLLREQTRGFEHIWYGLNTALANDYQAALDLHEQLRAT
jgi:hypothetical protein